MKVYGGDAEGDIILNVESLTGSDFGDVLTGTMTNNALRGGGGNDLLRPYAGGDYVDGGDGNDVLDYSYTGVGAQHQSGHGKGRTARWPHGHWRL